MSPTRAGGRCLLFLPCAELRQRDALEEEPLRSDWRGGRPRPARAGLARIRFSRSNEDEPQTRPNRHPTIATLIAGLAALAVSAQEQPRIGTPSPIELLRQSARRGDFVTVEGG